MSFRPLAIDLFTGLHGWSEGLVAEGWRVIGFDIEDMCAQFGEPRPEHVELILRNVLDIHGSEFAHADLIVASPPCQEYSYMAMPWSLAKAKAAAIRADETGAELERLNRLFNACFRIQREASEAAGRHIPMVVENVRGAIPWVGRSRWNYGSFHLWGDVPALMPSPRAMKTTIAHHPLCSIHTGTQGFRCDYDCARDFPQDGFKTRGHINKRDGNAHTRHLTNARDGLKQPGLSGTRDNGKGDAWFQDGAARHGSKSNARKAASARIAKIPLALSRWIAAHYLPETVKRERSAA